VNPINPNWPGDVFDAVLAQILEDKWQPVADVVMDRIGDEHSARLGQDFKPSRDIGPVAEDVLALGDYIPEVDPDAELSSEVYPEAITVAAFTVTVLTVIVRSRRVTVPFSTFETKTLA
jgi:hypothetical protein